MSHLNSVQTQHPEYTAREPQWQRMRDVIAGQDAVKDQKQLYLPPINSSDGPESEDYKLYLANAEFYNATGLTFEAFMGMIFRKPTEIGGNEDDELLANIDFEGTDIETFTEDITNEVGVVGRVGILFDMPTVEEVRELSVNEARAAGVRPYLKMYTAESIINWKFKNINGIRKVVSIVLQEEIEKLPDDPFSHDTEAQFRVLMIEDGLYVQKVFNEAGQIVATVDDILIDGERPDTIPFICINSNSIGLDTEKPPLLDMADTNLSHYRASGSLGACIHMFGRITPLFKVPHSQWEKFINQPLEYGVTKSIIIPTTGDGADADATFLEPKTDFTPIVNQQVRLEGRMAAQGARMLSPEKRGVESADTVRLDMIGELSILGSLANMVSRGVTIATTWVVGSETQVMLNTDFLTTPIDAGMVKSLLESLTAGKISQKQFTDAMITGEAIISEADIETDTDFTEPEPKEEEEAPQVGIAAGGADTIGAG